MGKRVQFIRHATGAADAFTGLIGEITVDTTAKELRVHDGLAAGGTAVARKDLVNVAVASASVAGKMSSAQVVELTDATAAIIVNAANLATEISDRISDVNAEESRALTAEGVIQSDVNANEVASDAADVVLQTNIDAEETRALAAEAAIPQSVIQQIYPVGSLYFGTTATNPNSILGFGTWGLYSANSMLVSAGGLYALGATGGSKDAIVVSHTHTFSGDAVADHQHDVTGIKNTSATRNHLSATGNSGSGSPLTVANAAELAGGHTPTGTNSNTGSSGTNANMPPYIAVNIWRRSA